MKIPRCLTPALASLLVLLTGSAALAQGTDPATPFAGHWALTIPDGGAGWLGVTGKTGELQATILWGGGSVVPVNSTTMAGSQLVLTRLHVTKTADAKGQTVTTTATEKITATVAGDTLDLVTRTTDSDGNVGPSRAFHGRRIPPVPPAPDLAKVKFGPPIQLFNGRDLAGWKLLDTQASNGWSAQGGRLVNEPVQIAGLPHRSYGNLRTVQEFEDFNLTLETRPTEGSNSGVYLRGIYEVQVIDSYGKPVDAHNMGAIYSRLTPSTSAEMPTGEWETLDITLVDRHVTVILNGTRIIDNQPVLGCTGGALWSDEFRPGPIYLQGDHAQIEYRNLVLRPVVK